MSKRFISTMINYKRKHVSQYVRFQQIFQKNVRKD